jgi:hypothetical protein
MEGKGVGGVQDHMELLGLAGGLEQVLGLAGQDLRIRCSLDQEHGMGIYTLNIASEIMLVKVMEKTGLEEELLGVVPACDGASLARGEERFAAEDRGEDRFQVRGRGPADDPVDALVVGRRGKSDCAAQAVADEIDRRFFQGGDGVRKKAMALLRSWISPVMVTSAKSSSLSPLPAKSKRSTANPCSRAQRGNLTNSRLSLTLSSVKPWAMMSSGGVVSRCGK